MIPPFTPLSRVFTEPLHSGHLYVVAHILQKGVSPTITSNVNETTSEF